VTVLHTNSVNATKITLNSFDVLVFMIFSF
jgi:hypothetical protein